MNISDIDWFSVQCLTLHGFLFIYTLILICNYGYKSKEFFQLPAISTKSINYIIRMDSADNDRLNDSFESSFASS